MNQTALAFLGDIENKLIKAGSELVSDVDVRNVGSSIGNAIGYVVLDAKAQKLVELCTSSTKAFLESRCMSDFMNIKKPVNTDLQRRAWADYRKLRTKLSTLPPSPMAQNLMIS